jgi:DNA polymerase III subunit beta
MKVTCEREKLLHAFQMASSVAPSRSPKPILQNIKLHTTPERATMLATDLEVGIRIEVPGVQVEVPGSVLLPIGRFGMILRESSDEKLHLETDGARTRVRGERSEFHLPTENPDEFPEVAAFSEEKYHKLPARFFRELVRRTIFATDNESSRYALGGVLIEISAENLIGVGTDGRRLAKQEGPAKAVGAHESRDRTIVPTRSMQLLERALADNEGEIDVAARENDLMVRGERCTIYTRLVEGRFPKWRDVFPKMDQMTRIEMSVGPFHSAVRQAGIVTDENHRGVDFTFGDGRLVLLARSAEAGESRVEMPVAYEGAEIGVMLDPRYVSDFLKVLDPDTTITLSLRDAESAVVASTADGYSYVIMPLARE